MIEAMDELEIPLPVSQVYRTKPAETYLLDAENHHVIMASEKGHGFLLQGSLERIARTDRQRRFEDEIASGGRGSQTDAMRVRNVLRAK